MNDIDNIFRKEKIAVVGLGVTGIPVIRMLASLGNSIIAIDNNASIDPEKVYSGIGDEYRDNVEIMLKPRNRLDGKVLDGVELVIASPGIPSDNILFKAAGEKGIPVWDELELSCRLLGRRQMSNIIAVTGTNGKTTVVNLMGAILSRAGLDNAVCGNVGSPVLDTITIDKDNRRAKDDSIIRVVEVSSFQLERTQSFKPGTGILLNITSDHIDRHGNIGRYSAIKMKLFKLQDSHDHAILNADDSMAAARIGEIEKRAGGPLLVRYGICSKKSPSVWYGDGSINYELPSGSGKLNIKGANLKGRHNMSNAAAAAAASLLAGAGSSTVEASIKAFKPLSHRMEYLGEVEGIRCINDSKSTNPDSIIAALSDFDKEVTIIMGGLDKDMDFAPIIPSLAVSVNSIILIGKSAERMDELFSRETDGIGIFRCGSMEDAVRKAFEAAKEGEVILLSPGCASMDMFENYRDRGDQFKKAVMERKNG